MLSSATSDPATLLPISDTWTWDSTIQKWSEWCPDHTCPQPSPRRGGILAYDKDRQQVVLYGGTALLGTQSDESTWTWDGVNWTEHKIPGPPSKAGVGSTAWDGTQVILFGGDQGTPGMADTWAWDGTIWTREFPLKSPAARFSPPMAFDESRNEVVLFGGFCRFFSTDCVSDGSNHTENSQCANLNGGQFNCYDDTWFWRTSAIGTPPAPRPVIRNISPSVGPATGGQEVNLVGENLSGSTSVAFGDQSVSCLSSCSVDAGGTRIQVRSPAHVPATVPVSASTLFGASNSLSYSYVPVVFRIDPACGPQSGGTVVKVTGAGFSNPDGVWFGDTSVQPAVVSDSDLTAVSPPRGPGLVSVTVGAAGLRSQTSAQFTYPCPAQPAPPPNKPSTPDESPSVASTSTKKPIGGGYSFGTPGSPPGTAPVLSGVPGTASAPLAQQTLAGSKSALIREAASVLPGIRPAEAPSMPPAVQPNRPEPEPAAKYLMIARDRSPKQLIGLCAVLLMGASLAYGVHGQHAGPKPRPAWRPAP